MATHEKIDRKTIAAPDEFQVASSQALSWIQTHRSALIAGAVGILVAGGVGAFASSQRQQAHSAAAVAFRDAHKQFADNKFAEAATAFQQVATQGAGTPFAALAVLYRGHALARQGDSAGAAAAYQEYLGSGPVDYLRQQALLGLGTAKEASGDAAGALEAYNQSRVITGPLQSDAGLGAARLEEAQGHADAARAIYAELLKDSGLDAAIRSQIVGKVPVEMRPADTAPPKS